MSRAWKRRAKVAESLVADAADRDLIFKRRQGVWKDAKEVLGPLGHDKCWYCEHKPLRDFLKVDHFRPKGKVADRPDHPGYWWLAFDVSNYRLACTFCNSLHEGEKGTAGKGNQFPIFDEATRAMSEIQSIDDEIPLLLDPTCRDDTDLLWFREDGALFLRNVDTPHDDVRRLRVDLSIRIYDLNAIQLQEARRLRMRDMRDLIEDADQYLVWLVERGPDADVSERYLRCVDRIRDMIEDRAEYSVASLHALVALRESPSAETILSNLADAF